MTLNVGATFPISVQISGQAGVDALSEKMRQMRESGVRSAREVQYAMRMLPAQFTDIATQLAGGQNPFLILLQQGGQIRDQFGSVGAALRGIASFITPTSLAIGGLTAVVGGFTAAVMQAERQATELQRAIQTTGNFAGTTASQFDAMSNRVRAAANISAGASRELLTGAVGSGAFGPQTIEAVATAMGNLQRITGQSSKEVVKLFTDMRDGVAEWAQTANRAYNFLSAEEFKRIKQLEEVRGKEAAMLELMSLFNERVGARVVELGTLQNAWKKVKDAAASAWEAMLNIGKQGTLASQLQNAERELARMIAARDPESVERLPARQRDRIAAEINAQSALVATLRQRIATEDELAAKTANAASNSQREIAQMMEKQKQAASERRSEFDQLLRRYQDQLMSAQKLSLEEQFLAEVQLGRYKDLSAAQVNQLQMLAREIDGTKAQAELEKERAREREQQQREDARLLAERNREIERESDRLEALRQKYIELGDPVEKYRKQLEEIQFLTENGYLTDKQAIDAMNALREKGKDTFADLTRAIEGWGRKATDTFIEFAFKGKATFSDLVSSILQDIARIMVQRNIMGPLMNAIFPMAKTSAPLELGGWVASLTGATAFARGGVVTRPTMFPFANGAGFRTGIMGEAGPEAIMPLRRGPDGRLGVEVAGGGGVNVSVTVNAQTGEQSVQGAQGRAAQLGSAIAAAVRAEIITQKRPGGLLAAGA